MARKAAVQAATIPTPYDLMAQRVKRVILSPRCQIERRALIARMPDESPEDWEILLEQINEEDTVTVTRLDDGSVQISWTIHKPD